MKIDPESWPRLSRLLDEWLDLPAESRAGWLENLGPEHAEVLPALRRLMNGDALLTDLPRMYQSDAGSGGDGVFLAGMQIGPYRLLRELGQGGMGAVWLAERADREVKRPVALKLPFVSLHTRTLAERFARERDILAQLTHPSIARLYDAGVADGGQPFLALECVDGEKITDYCDHRNLSLRARLELFLQVARAVQYAHSNLIVHRDLKPANILVNNAGEVRLLDFGIAKLLTEGRAAATEITRTGGGALTPDYASPEQIAGETITTASDLYSLGVILYELLTGERPYKLKRDTRGGLEDAILHAEPQRPSQTAANAAIAEARGLTPKKLARALKGDLDTIVLKALNKQPAERYASADALAQDIERYLAGEAVLAQPESAWYRGRKFVLRNKLAVGSACAIIAALALGLGIALREAHIAQVQTRTAETVRSFLLDIFRANSIAQSDPVKARKTTARELLDLGAKRMDDALNGAPEAKLALLETLFRMYADLGLQDQAVPLGRKRVALARSIYGVTHPEVARALLELASDSGESSFASERPALLKEAGSILDRNRDFTSRTRALYYLAMGNASVDTDLASGAALAARSIQLYRQYPASRELVAALNMLGQRQSMQARYAEAIVSLSEAASIANSLQGDARRPLPAIYAILGDAQRKTLDLKGAEKSSRLALETARGLKGEDSVDFLQTEWRLGVFLAQTARPEEGLDLLQRAVDLTARTSGPDEAFHTPMVLRGFGVHAALYGRVEEGLTALGQAIDIQRRAHHMDRDFCYTLDYKAVAETVAGHYREAKALFDEADAIRSRLGGNLAWELNDSVIARARFLIATGKADEASGILRDSPVRPDFSGSITYDWLDVSLARASADLARAQPEAAIRQAESVRKRIEESGLQSYFKRWDAQAESLEGKGLSATKRAAEALPLLQRAVQLGAEVYDRERSPELADLQVALGSCLFDLGRRDEARALLGRAKAIHGRHQDLGEQFRSPLRKLEARAAGRS